MTDAIVAFAAFVLLFVLLALGVEATILAFGFIPAEFLAGGWHLDPVRAWLSPLASAFLPLSIASALFSGVLFLIAGRFVEKAIGGLGLVLLFVAAAYAGAAARMLLTPGSIMPSAGLDAALFAVVGAYLTLYGVPQALPVPRHLPRALQIGTLLLFWLALQLVFALAAGGIEPSTAIVEPVGGLLAGLLLARPLLALRWRSA